MLITCVARIIFIEPGVGVIPKGGGFISSRLLLKREPWYGWWDAWQPPILSLNQSRVGLHGHFELLFCAVQ
jgi:hypothetical protein